MHNKNVDTVKGGQEISVTFNNNYKYTFDKLETSLISEIRADIFMGWQLDNNIKITNDNKIAICRTLEQVISNMNNDMFSYINKLQSFTSLALYK